MKSQFPHNDTASVTIALDAMGGDRGPRMVVSGAAKLLKKRPNTKYVLFGDERILKSLLKRHIRLRKATEIRHCTEAVANDDKPAHILRNGKATSMYQAIKAVKDGEADCVVSAGNTGALMVLARMLLKSLPEIDRPAIATFMPNAEGQSVVLDLGANVECSAQNLVQFAILGSVFARAVAKVEAPTIGLINVGIEQQKGHESVKQAASMLRKLEPHMHGKFHGFIEGDDVAAGTVDVVVTDGFTGNVLLKTAEGTARLIGQYMKQAMKSSPLAKLGFMIGGMALRRMRKRIDPRIYNGAMFLGLAGVCVKSHGGTDALGFANALQVAANLVANNFNDKVRAEMEAMADPLALLKRNASDTQKSTAQEQPVERRKPILRAVEDAPLPQDKKNDSI